jgi:hypothetical protein
LQRGPWWPWSRIGQAVPLEGLEGLEDAAAM